MLRKLEKYEVLDEIGHGGMATVYRARDSSLDRFVALKVLHPHLQRTAEARARFAREAKSVAKLRHPHILEIYDYSGEASDETYIAAELLTGPTLKDLVLARKELPPEIGLLTALAHLYLTGCTLEHYWQIYWASYWNSPSKLFTGRFTAHITGKKDYCPVTGVPVTTKHVTGAAVTTKREHMRASVNRQLGQLLCRAPECGLFWGMQPHTVGIRTAQGRVTCAARTGVRGRCEPEGWHAR